MAKKFKLFKDGKTKSVDTKEEAEKCITNGWTLVEDAQSFQVGFSRSGIVKLASANLEPWQAFNEFIANAIDSWIDSPKKPRPRLRIEIDINQESNLSKSTIHLTDNALGMNQEGLENATKEFLGSTKAQGKNKNLYLGMFGFGLLGSSFLLGKSLTVITTKDNKTHSKFSLNEVEYLNGKDADIISYKADTQDKKIFKNSGTRIIISDFKDKLSPAVLSDYLKLSWKYYLAKNHLGNAVDIEFSFNKNKVDIIETPMGSHANRPVYEESKIPINIEFEWKDPSTKEVGKSVVKGKIGISGEGGQSGTSGGFNLYRRGQLIETYNREFYAWGAMTARMHGDLFIDLPVSMQKNGYNKGSEAWKACVKALTDSIIYDVGKISGKFTRAMFDEKTDKDIADKDKYFAEYRQKFGLPLTDKQKRILRKPEGDPEPPGGDPEPPGGDPEPPGGDPEPPEQEIKFKIKSIFEFKFDDINQSVEFVFGQNYKDKDPWFPMPDWDSGKLLIGVNKLSSIHDDIEKAYKNINTGTNKLLIKTIALDCIKQILKHEDYEIDIIARFSGKYIEI